MRLSLPLIAITMASISVIVPAQESSSAAAAHSDLVYVIYVSRHGVRSPTGKSSQYDRFSSAAWPTWSVQPGYLTPHGYELMRLFGAYDRIDLEERGLFKHAACVDAGRVTFHADSDQRTRETARALAEGMFPGCSVGVQALAEGTNDPIFHLPPSAITAQDGALGAAAISGRVGENPAGIADDYHQQLAELDAVLANCGVTAPSTRRTSIFDVPVSIVPGADDHIAEMRGPLNTASTLAENLLLEYVEGFDKKDVGWGCVDGAKLRRLIGLHTAAFDLAQRTLAISVPQVLPLLQVIDRSLQQAITGKPVQGALGKPGDKALFLVGHDTNLANLSGALGLDWLLDGRSNDTPPGSTLIIELWKSSKPASYSVRMYFTTQTLEQMRNSEPLNESRKPPRVRVFIPGCSQADGACAAAAFQHAIESIMSVER